MLHSVDVSRFQLIELAVGLDATMEIPDGGGGISICNLLLRAIPTSIDDFQRRQPLELTCCKAESKEHRSFGVAWIVTVGG